MKENIWEIYLNALKKQDWLAAVDALEKISAAEKDNPQVYLKLGDAYQRMGDTERAVSSYHRSAGLLRSQGFSHKSVALYKIILRLDPYNSAAIVASGELLKELAPPRPALPQKESSQPAVPVRTDPGAGLPPQNQTFQNIEPEIKPDIKSDLMPDFGLLTEPAAGSEPAPEDNTDRPDTNSVVWDSPAADLIDDSSAVSQWLESTSASSEAAATPSVWTSSEQITEIPDNAGISDEIAGEPPVPDVRPGPQAGGDDLSIYTEENSDITEGSAVPAPSGDRLPHIPDLFSGMPAEEFYSLLAGMKKSSFSSGVRIVEEGDSGDSMYLVCSGRTRVVAHLLGREIELATLGEGDLFGEVAFLTGRPRTAAVVADGDVEVYEISRLDIEKVIEKNPGVLARLEDFNISRVKDTIKKIIPGQSSNESSNQSSK